MDFHKGDCHDIVPESPHIHSRVDRGCGITLNPIHRLFGGMHDDRKSAHLLSCLHSSCISRMVRIRFTYLTARTSFGLSHFQNQTIRNISLSLLYIINRLSEAIIRYLNISTLDRIRFMEYTSAQVVQCCFSKGKTMMSHQPMLYPEDLAKIHRRVVVGNIARIFRKAGLALLVAAAFAALYSINSWSPIVADALIKATRIG